MAAMEPELFLPAHGLPIHGKERIARVLDSVATAPRIPSRTNSDAHESRCKTERYYSLYPHASLAHRQALACARLR